MGKQAQLNDLAILILRVVGGLVLLYYGSQKMLGVFGGGGFAGTINMMSKNIGVPPVLAVFAIFAEFFGSLGLIVGLLTRVAAFGVFCTMSVACWTMMKTIHTITADSTNMNPIQPLAYPLLIGTIALALLLLGGGSYSLDAKLFGKRRKS